MSKIRSGLLGVATVAALLGTLPTTVFADYQPTAAQRSACMGDAFKLCAAELSNMDRVVSCLQRQKAKVSPGCRAHFDRAGM